MELVFNAKHNICANLELFQKNGTDFQEAIGFLRRSKLAKALLENPTIFEDHIREFWGNAIISDTRQVRRIKSKIEDKSIVISEAVIRRILEFDDALGIEILSEEEVQAVFRRMGYEGPFPRSMVKKANVSYQWRFLLHVFIHCLSSRRAGFDELSLKLSSSFVALTTGRTFNFSGMVFHALVRNVEDTKNKFLMYPRFLQMIINSEIQDLSTAGKELKLEHMNWKVFKHMKKDHPRSTFSGNYTALFTNMLQANLEEGEGNNEADTQNVIGVGREEGDASMAVNVVGDILADVQIGVNSDASVDIEVVADSLSNEMIAESDDNVGMAEELVVSDSSDSDTAVDPKYLLRIGKNPTVFTSSVSESIRKSPSVASPVVQVDQHDFEEQNVEKHVSQRYEADPPVHSQNVPVKSFQSIPNSLDSDLDKVLLHAEVEDLKYTVQQLHVAHKAEVQSLKDVISTQQIQIETLTQMFHEFNKKKSSRVVYTSSSEEFGDDATKIGGDYGANQEVNVCINEDEEEKEEEVNVYINKDEVEKEKVMKEANVNDKSLVIFDGLKEYEQEKKDMKMSSNDEEVKDDVNKGDVDDVEVVENQVVVYNENQIIIPYNAVQGTEREHGMGVDEDVEIEDGIKETEIVKNVVDEDFVHREGKEKMNDAEIVQDEKRIRKRKYHKIVEEEEIEEEEELILSKPIAKDGISEKQHRDEMKNFLLSKGFSAKRFRGMKTSKMEEHVNKYMMVFDEKIEKETEFDEDLRKAIENSLKEVQQQQQQQQLNASFEMIEKSKEKEQQRQDVQMDFEKRIEERVERSRKMIQNSLEKSKGFYEQIQQQHLERSKEANEPQQQFQQQQIKSQSVVQQRSTLNVTDKDCMRDVLESLKAVKSKNKPKIIGWKYDFEKKAFQIKRQIGYSEYYYNKYNIMKLPKIDLEQLSKLELVNHGNYSEGRDFQVYLRKQVKNKLDELKTGKLKKKMLKESKDYAEKYFAIKEKNTKKTASLGKILGWYYDRKTMEAVVRIHEGGEYRMYEYSDLKNLCTEDILQLNQHYLYDSQGEEEGKMFIVVLQELVNDIFLKGKK